MSGEEAERPAASVYASSMSLMAGTRGIRTPSLLISAQVVLGTCLQIGRLGVRISLVSPVDSIAALDV